MPRAAAPLPRAHSHSTIAAHTKHRHLSRMSPYQRPYQLANSRDPVTCAAPPSVATPIGTPATHARQVSWRTTHTTPQGGRAAEIFANSAHSPPNGPWWMLQRSGHRDASRPAPMRLRTSRDVPITCAAHTVPSAPPAPTVPPDPLLCQGLHAQPPKSLLHRTPHVQNVLTIHVPNPLRIRRA